MEVSAKTSNAITEVTPRTRMASWMLNPIFGVDRLPKFLMRDIETSSLCMIVGGIAYPLQLKERRWG